MFISFRRQRKFHRSPTFDLAYSQQLGFQCSEMGFCVETGQGEVKVVQGTIEQHHGA